MAGAVHNGSRSGEMKCRNKGSAEVRCAPKACAWIVGGGILDAPYDGAACKWGVRDAAPYAPFPDCLLRKRSFTAHSFKKVRFIGQMLCYTIVRNQNERLMTMYQMRYVGGHVQVYDLNGKFLFSADTEREAREEWEDYAESAA